jgi:hypothetical protein
MYLIRTNSFVDLILYLLLSSFWGVGGWLLATHAFKLRYKERFLCGLALGFLLFIGLSCLFANVFSLTAAFWLAALTIFLSGMIVTWRSKMRPRMYKLDLSSILLIIVLVLLTLLFTVILFGESIFDEYLHLPLISIMAAGDIPPHFYLNSGFYFAYHYSIQVFAASLVRLAGLFPWSAWDISRALAIAFTLTLGWIWVRRLTRSRTAAWLGTVLFTFGGGMRYVLLLLPAKWLAWISQSVHLVGSGFDTALSLPVALHQPWLIEGGGNTTFPFAFHNGIFVPAFFTLGSTGAMPYLTILILLLLLPRGRFTNAGLIVWSLMFATLALSAEHLFVVLWAGIAIAIVISVIFHKRLFKSFPRVVLIQWGIILLLSALLSLIQGGFITETARNLLASISGSITQSYNARGFSMRWPPGLLSAHLGSLSILDPGQLVALLAELGLALFLIPVIFIRFSKNLRHKDWFTAGLSISVVLSLVFPLFFQYEVDRSITRMPATALWTCLVLGFPILWMAFSHGKTLLRLSLVVGYVMIILPGIVLFWSQLKSIPSLEYSYYIDDLDAAYSDDYWNRLPKETQVLDRVPERSVTIFGRISNTASGIYDPLPEWEALIADPIPATIAAAGYDYVYMDKVWWDKLTRSQQLIFEAPCVDIIDERKDDYDVDYRVLANVSACR